MNQGDGESNQALANDELCMLAIEATIESFRLLKCTLFVLGSPVQPRKPPSFPNSSGLFTLANLCSQCASASV